MDLREPPAPTLEGLRVLHRAQIRKVPFENLDILLGRGIDVSRPAIFAKCVDRRRGGYCFEVNELLFAALQAFGFQGRRGLARVHITGVPGGLSHQIALAAIEGVDYLVDAGFGGPSPRGPLPVIFDAVTEIDYKRYRFVDGSPFGILLQDWFGGAWRNLYSFDDRLVTHPDRVQGNHFTSSHPSNFFTWGRSASIQVASGRFSMLDSTLTHETATGISETLIPDGEAYLEVLETVFGIELDARFEDLKPLNPRPIP